MTRALCSLKSQRGQTMVEYALILALVAIVVIVAIRALGPALVGIFNQIVAAL